MNVDSSAASIFDVFFAHWSRVVAGEYFSGEAAELVAAAAGGLALALLHEDAVGWFAPGRRLAAVRQALAAALDTLATRLGPELSGWQWGKLHRIQARHVLSNRGDLAALLDQPPVPVRGNMLTVCNTGSDADWQATLGAGYRMLVDMATAPAEMWAIDAGSESGHPGSPHYADQMPEWIAGQYHRIPLARSAVEEIAKHRLTLRRILET